MRTPPQTLASFWKGGGNGGGVGGGVGGGGGGGVGGGVGGGGDDGGGDDGGGSGSDSSDDDDGNDGGCSDGDEDLVVDPPTEALSRCTPPRPTVSALPASAARWPCGACTFANLSETRRCGVWR